MSYRKITILALSFLVLNTVCMSPHKNQCSKDREENMKKLKAFQNLVPNLNATQIECYKEMFTQEIEDYKNSLLCKKEQLFDALE